MLDRARFLVVSEISEVLHEGQPAIEAKVDRALDRSLTTRARVAPARIKTAPKIAAPPVVVQRRAARAS
jgi:hypothetical protein